MLDGDLAFVRIEGDLDWYTSPQLERRLTELFDRDARQVVVELAELSFMDLNGLRTLASAVMRLRAHGGEIRLRSVRRNVTKLFALTGLAELLSQQ